jgi:hypothetical protein
MPSPSIRDPAPSSKVANPTAGVSHGWRHRKRAETVQKAIKAMLLAAGLATGPYAAAGRIVAATSLGHDDASNELTQAIGRSWDPLAGVPFQFGPPLAPGPPGPSRVACEEEVDRPVGLAAYLKSKMRLQDGQQTASQNVKQTALPGVEKIQNLCPRPSSQLTPELGALHYIGFAPLELLRAVRDPLQALYERLSSDWRAILTAGLQSII